VSANFKASSVMPFMAYTADLRQRLRLQLNCTGNIVPESIAAALDGQPSRELRRLVPLADRRRDGIFFTGSELAEVAAKSMSEDQSSRLSVADVTCGVGDLLLAAARHMAVKATVTATLTEWGTRLRGFDIHPILVDACRIRICMLAIQRGARPDNLRLIDLPRLLPNIRNGDYRDHLHEIAKVQHLLLNPPYVIVEDDRVDRTWGNGNFCFAAQCILECLEHAKAGCKLTAILPDVLRTGSTYSKWRSKIDRLTLRSRTKIVGQFDAMADVDVFLLTATVGDRSPRRKSPWWTAVANNSTSVGDFFDTHVGPVVPHRHVSEGPVRRYIHAKDLPAWQFVHRIKEKLRFRGRVFRPPFVVVRRTSRPDQKYRCIATIIGGNGPVAVENHLIVLSPHNNRLTTCRALIRNFREERVSNWFDQRIRCRHLTVASLAGMPFQN
jgi:hypothetical protein